MPLALGGIVMLLMYTWRRGSRLLFEKSRKLEFPLADLVAMLEKRPPQRVPGTAVFLTSDPDSAPTALMHSLKHYKVLHEKNVILTIETAPTPRIDPAERVRMEQLSATFSKVTLRFGFMESPNVPKTLAIARKLGWQFDIMSTSFFLSRRALKPAAHSGMPRWQDHAVHRAQPLRQRRHRLFPDPDRAGGRSRNAGYDLGSHDPIRIQACVSLSSLDHISTWMLPFTAWRRFEDALRLFEVRRRSILELAPSGMSVRRRRGLGEPAHARRNGAQAPRAGNMDCRA